MYTFRLLLSLVNVFVFLIQRGVNGASLSTSLSSGVCLCVNEPNVAAIKDPTNLSSVVGTLSNGVCFKTHGGIYHESSITYYELVDNGQTAWVDSFYLSVASIQLCDNRTVVSTPNYHTPEGRASECTLYGRTYIHGEKFTAVGLNCVCDDGATLCTLEGDHCFSGGIVYKHGTAFMISGRGSCTCSNGHVLCNAAVGK